MGVTEFLLHWEPHPTIRSESDLTDFHERVSLWNVCRRNRIHPVVFSLVFTVLVSAPGAILTFGYDVSHPLLTGPMLAVLTCNTLLSFFALFFVDKRFIAVMIRIQRGFDIDSKEYFPFIGRMFVGLYHYSFFTPISPGPHGRRQRPLFWIGLVGSYALWLGVVWWLAPLSFPADPVASGLLAGYFFLVVGWATMTLFTVITFVVIMCLFLGIRASQFPIRLNIMRRDSNFGLEPYGDFLFHMLGIGMGMIAIAGVAGLLGANPLLFLFAGIGTPILIVWFIASQYGLHYAMVRTKRTRLARLDEQHNQHLDKVFLESTPEPDIDTIQKSDPFITIKDEIESFPNWPTSMQTVYRVVTTIAVTNMPTVVGLLL